MRLRWLLSPLAALTLGTILWILLRGEGRSAADVLSSARGYAARREPGRALRELEEALRLARRSGERELTAEILRARAELQRVQRLPQLCLADCRTLLREFGPEAGTLELACRVSLEQGEPAQALEFAHELAPLDATRALPLIGECRVALGDRPLARLDQRLREVAPPAKASALSRLALRAAVFAGAPGEPAPALDELLEHLPNPDDRRLALELVREASEHLAAARGALVQSLEPAPSAATIAGLQDLLLRAGADLEAADLGQLALELPALLPRMPVLARTAGAFQRLGRSAAAKGLIIGLQRRNPSLLAPDVLSSNELRDELREWTELLAELELWGALRASAETLAERARARQDPATLALAAYYRGLAELRSGKPAQARAPLEQASARPAGDSHFLLRTWLALAEVARGQRQGQQERYALLLATKAAPPDPPEDLRADVGAAWLRYSELQAGSGDNGLAALTHALCCLPARAGELEPRWHELGQQALGSRGAIGPYHRYAFTRSLTEQGQHERALSEARSLLSDFPGLAPVLTLAMRSAFALGDHAAGVAYSLELLERGHVSQEASARLRRTPTRYFPPEERVRWMRVDPRGSLSLVVERLLERGELEGAALAALGSPARFQPPDTQLLLARVLLDARRFTQASAVFLLLEPESSEFRGAAGLSLLAAMHAAEQARAPAELRQALELVRLSGLAEDARLLGAADALLAAGQLPAAAELVGWLADQETPWPGEILLRAAALRVLRGDGPGASELLERTLPFLEDGRAELGHLILSLEREDWKALEEEARLALVSPLGQSPVARALLAVLSGERESARAPFLEARHAATEPALELGLAALGRLDPGPWPQVDGRELEIPPLPAAFEGLDPRALLVYLLAAESAPWGAWTLARLRQLPSGVREGTWLGILRARAFFALGDLDHAELALQPWTPPACQAPPERPDRALSCAASLMMRVLAAGPQPERVRAKRLEELELAWLQRAGLGDDPNPELALPRARLCERAGQREEAVAVIEQALLARPADAALLRAQAELERVPGRRTQALTLLRGLLADLPTAQQPELVASLLDELRAARDEGEISEARWWNEVEALEAEFPRDPAPPRELAARAFERQAPQGEPQEHAYQRLERFRERTARRPLESLRAGEARRWIELLARVDPERAVRLAQAELAADPANTELWRSSCSALVAAGRLREALADLSALQRVAPERETARLHLLTRLRVEANGRDFLAGLKAIEELDPAAGLDPELGFYRAVAALERSAGDELAQLVEQALARWQRRAELGPDSVRHGRALALALFRAGYAEPAQRVLVESVATGASALERDLATALGNLMRARMSQPNPPAPRAAPAPRAEGAKEPGKKAAGKAGPKKRQQ